jgi:hypothetical protein
MPHAALSQAEILTAIADIVSGSEPVRRIDTHASTVFLAGAQARDITFTLGATESNNIAIKGAVMLDPARDKIVTCIGETSWASPL